MIFFIYIFWFLLRGRVPETPEVSRPQNPLLLHPRPALSSGTLRMPFSRSEIHFNVHIVLKK